MKTLRKTLAAFTTFTTAMAASVAAQAAMANHAEVNGIRTFQGTTTGPATAIGQGRGLWACMASAPAGGGNTVPEPAPYLYLLVGLALMAAANRTKVPSRDARKPNTAH